MFSGSTIRDSNSTLYPGFFYLPNLLSRLYISLGFFEKKALFRPLGKRHYKIARARESSRRPQKSSRKTTPRSTHGVSQWYHQIARAPLVRLFGTTFRDGRALCVVDDDAQRRVSLRDVSNRCAKKGGRAEVDAERVDENDPTKTTRKTTTPLVRERRDEECKHREEEKDGTDVSKTIITDSQEEKVPKTSDGVHTKKGEKRRRRQTYMLAHPVYDFGYIESIRPRHRQPQGARDYVSMFAVWSARKGFSAVAITRTRDDEGEWLFRFIFLETVAGIPGMVAGMLRHMHSLRLLRHDNGWIHTLLEEAENERMHLMTFLNMKQPSILFKRACWPRQRGFF